MASSLKSKTGFAASTSLKSRLPEIATELQAKVAAAVKAGAEIVAEDAVAKLEVGGHVTRGDGEHLADEIHVERIGAAEYSVQAGNKDVFWGHFLERGTDHSPPYPFLVPALEENEDTVVFLVQGALEGL